MLFFTTLVANRHSNPNVCMYIYTSSMVKHFFSLFLQIASQPLSFSTFQTAAGLCMQITSNLVWCASVLLKHPPASLHASNFSSVELCQIIPVWVASTLLQGQRGMRTVKLTSAFSQQNFYPVKFKLGVILNACTLW